MVKITKLPADTIHELVPKTALNANGPVNFLPIESTLGGRGHEWD